MKEYSTVRDILSKSEYMGHTVNFRSYKESYKDKRAKKAPKGYRRWKFCWIVDKAKVNGTEEFEDYERALTKKQQTERG